MPNTILPPYPLAKAATVLNTVRLDSVVSCGSWRLNSIALRQEGLAFENQAWVLR